jgi:hypothetical protein
LGRFLFFIGFFVAAFLGLLLSARAAHAQDTPYFVTYSHQMEEPGSLEIEFNPVFGTQRGGNDFLAATTEFEYGVRGWWTTEFYLDGQTTFGDSSIFTGWRWENRFRPLAGEHWINPVLYLEYENTSDADKTIIEVVGFDSEVDQAPSNAVLRRNVTHELESKLILSSNFRGWNISENFISEKNLAGEPWEFGYAAGVSRPLVLAASAHDCNFCPENFVAGMEIYGGLGTADAFTLSQTSHYIAPIVGWEIPNGVTLRVAPSLGLNGNSHRLLLRFGVSYEIGAFRRRVSRFFRGSAQESQ